MGAIQKLRNYADGWANLLTGLGSTYDKAFYTSFQAEAHPSAQELENVYRGHAIAKRIVDLPVQDMFRAGFSVDVQDNEDAGQVAKGWLEDSGALVAIRKAVRWSRLYGGAVVFMAIDDGREPTEPVADRIRRFGRFTPLPKGSVELGKTVMDPDDPRFGQPAHYKINDMLVHPDRVLRFDGSELPPGVSTNDGWGDSVLMPVMGALKDYGIANAALASIVNDFTQSVYKMKDLHDIATRNGQDAIQARLQVVDRSRAVMNAIMLDADMEDFQRLSTPVGGLPELLDRLALRLSAATGIPMTLLFGMTPGGFAKGDEAGQANWDDVVSEHQRMVLEPALARVLWLYLPSAEGLVRGAVPEFRVTFTPLVQPTPKEDAELRKMVAETDAIYMNYQVLRNDEVARQRFGPDGWSMETIADAGDIPELD